MITVNQSANVQVNLEHDGNHIYFNNPVTKGSIDSLARIIKLKNNELQRIKKNPLVNYIKPNPLYLHITTDGGDFIEALRAVDLIKSSKIPIYTVAEGHVSSAGTIMAVVGKNVL